MVALAALTGCKRLPPLHLHEDNHLVVQFPTIELGLDVYWDYSLDVGWSYDPPYHWRDEWLYGWDATDRQIWGDSIGYSERPSKYNLRRYFTGNNPATLHWMKESFVLYDTIFLAKYDLGYYDLLAWNEVQTIDGVQAIHIDEETTLDSVWAYTNPSRMVNIRSTHSGQAANTTANESSAAHYQPEALVSGYYRDLEITNNLEDYTYDPVRDVYYKHINMKLEPVTYIYLTQVILRHNYGRIDNVQGDAVLTGMAVNTNLNTGIAGWSAASVHYNTRLKHHCTSKTGEDIDIAGGRLYTFGICGVNPNRVLRRNGHTSGTENTERTETEMTADELMAQDTHRHYMDIQMVFYNGKDSVLSFDVTDQVRRLYRGGVITVELDMDTVPIPGRSGSLFDVLVADPDSVTYEFDM